MEFFLLMIPTIICVVASSTYASPIDQYWRSMLPHTPVPPYLQRQIQLGANSSHPYIYRPVVNVAYLFPYKYVKGIKEITDKYDISNTTIFFLHKDMVPRTKMWPRYYKSIPDHGFLPRQVADSIPFSTDKIPEILEHFSIKPESAEAAMIRGTLAECEAPSMKGAEKNCATSLESLIDFNLAKFGGNNNIRVISTDIPEDFKRQEYTIAAKTKLIGDNAVISHKLTYPYALFYSHWISDTKVYWVPLVGVDGRRVKLVTVCHMDTSYWYEGHIAFQVLKVKPGVPICHFPGSDTLIWVHKEAS